MIDYECYKHIDRISDNYLIDLVTVDYIVCGH